MILRSILALTGLSTPFAASQMYVPLSCRLTFGSDSRLPELCFSPEGSIWYCKTNEKHTINSDFMILSKVWSFKKSFHSRSFVYYEGPSPDEMPKVNVKSEALPLNFLLK